MKPTRIIQQPVAGVRGSGMDIMCNNGETYTMRELARAIGISLTTLRRRIGRYGWRDEHILKKCMPKRERPRRVLGTPTKIIAPPIAVVRGKGKPNLLYPCDDGRRYMQHELAEITGVSRQLMSQRLRKYGWQHPVIFQGNLRKTQGVLLDAIPDTPRDENLQKIKVGSWERRI